MVDGRYSTVLASSFIFIYKQKTAYEMRISDWSSDVCSSDVAASDVGGHRELIRDGETGTLFAADSPPAIANALAGLLGNRAGWDDRKARARGFVERERNWSSNICRYERSEEHTSELQSLMRISYAVFCLKKKNKQRV